jgi:hypothetical protein
MGNKIECAWKTRMSMIVFVIKKFYGRVKAPAALGKMR